MNVQQIAQVSSVLSAQNTAVQANVITLKLANDQIKAQGQAALQLIQSIPQPVGNSGNNINLIV